LAFLFLAGCSAPEQPVQQAVEGSGESDGALIADDAQAVEPSAEEASSEAAPTDSEQASGEAKDVSEGPEAETMSKTAEGDTKKPAPAGDKQPSGDEEAERATAVDGGNKHALLVGCTVYPNLDERFHLEGPANDVVLAQKMLVERFEFPEENVVILADHVGGDDYMPTRANVERQWQALAQKATRGDQIVVLMAGHGTQTPQAGGADDESEADGLDEVFLPRDVGPWSDTVGAVENAIKDDDIRNWIVGIRSKGANLWVIIDACHSGTMTRAAGDEVKREIRPEDLGVPEAVLDRAAASAEPGEDAAEEETQLLDDEPEQTRSVDGGAAAEGAILVAMYAAQSIEPTVEKKMPRRGADRKYFGLLTYTMNEILSQAESKMTYRELVQRVHRQYVRWGRTSPTPVLEGNGVDREVLGVESFPERARILITGNRFSGWKVNAGALNGVTSGSILAVYPPAGEADADKAIGHVRILEDGFQAVEAKIEPCEHDGAPAPEELAAGMRCKPVYVDFGDQRLRVCADMATDKNEPVPADRRDGLAADLEDFADEHKHLVQAMDDPADADWLLRYDSLESKQLFLTPASGWHGQKEGKLPPLFGPAPEGDELVGWLNDALTRISRVQSLLRISGGGGSQWADTSKLDVQIVRYKDANDKEGQPVAFDRGGIRLYNGDKVGFQVKNMGQEPLDVTLLLIDSGYGIHPLYPTPGATNRLYPGNQVLKRGSITAETTGLEHLLVIALNAKPVDSPVNFSFLSQPTIERSRAVGGENLNSPLGKIFQNALYGEGNTRGFAADEIDNYLVQTLSWKTFPEAREE